MLVRGDSIPGELAIQRTIYDGKEEHEGARSAISPLTTQETSTFDIFNFELCERPDVATDFGKLRNGPG